MGIRNRRARKHSRTHIVGFSAVGVLGFLALLAIALTVSLGALIESWLQDLPDYTSADAYLVAEPSEVYDASGNVIATFYLENRRSVTQDQVSDYVLKATVDVEDERFYTHNGIDPIGILRAVAAQLSGRSEGASTITQQLVRNTVLSDEQFDKTLKRKVREAYIAVEMEKTYSKDQILMMYLNTIYYGHGAYGIEAASITYFNKSASELTLAEAATLAGIPNSPSYYDPTVNPEDCKTRRNKVLDNMLSCGDITQEEHDAAQAEDIVLDLGSTNADSEGTYPYWTNYIKGLLEGDFSQETIVQSGLKIYTTIDPDWQSAAENAVSEYLSNCGNDELEQALVAIDPSTGYIKAMVGGRDYWGESDSAQVNGATSTLRQTGSSFKIFTLVAALEAGMNPDVYINCNSPITIADDYKVQNFNNTSYGTQSLRYATALSSNTGYMQVAEAIGTDNVWATAKKMGYNSEIDPYYSSIIGSSGGSPLEMAASYATLASGGVKRDPVAITKIEDRHGNTVYEHQDSPTQAVDESVAKAATEILEMVVNNSSGTAYSMNNYLTISQPLAGKTGSTEWLDNLWFCGYTPQVSVAVWTGYKNIAGSNAATVYVNGVEGHPYNTSCRTFAYFVNNILTGTAYEDWPMANAKDPTYKQNSEWKFSNTNNYTNNPYESEDASDGYYYEENSGSTVYDGSTDTYYGESDTTSTYTNSNSSSNSSSGTSGGGTSGGTSGGSSGGSSGGGTSGGSSGGTSGGGSTSTDTSGGTSEPTANPE